MNEFTHIDVMIPGRFSDNKVKYNSHIAVAARNLITIVGGEQPGKNGDEAYSAKLSVMMAREEGFRAMTVVQENRNATIG